MNHYQIVWLEQFLRPAIHLLAPLWPVIRPLLRLATALTAATVAFQLTAEEGLGIWLALGAGLMSWNFLFKAPPNIANAVIDVIKVDQAELPSIEEHLVESDDWYNDPSFRHHHANNYHHH
jgi:hypothetical protein